MMDLRSILLLLAPVILALLYPSIASDDLLFFLETSKAIVPQPARILLVTAHPDDECMFFAPTVRSLLSPQSLGLDTALSELKAASEVYSLTLSTGDADGLGEVRKLELERSLDVLGIASSKRWVLDDANLRDNITLPWEADAIAKAVLPYVTKNQITTILTFDAKGVSAHPNHASIPTGIRALIDALPSSQVPPSLYTLKTSPVALKYTSVLAALLTKLEIALTRTLRLLSLQLIHLMVSAGLDIPPVERIAVHLRGPPVFVAGAADYLAAVQAMREHESQLEWFRYLYVAFSRYMWVNQWEESK